MNDINSFIVSNFGSKFLHELTKEVNLKFNKDLSVEAVRNRYRNHRVGGRTVVTTKVEREVEPQELVSQDRKVQRLAEAEKTLSKKYKYALETIAKLETEVEAFGSIRHVESHAIKPKSSNGKGEAVAVVLASDWHIEERVEPGEVNGKKQHSLAISEKRDEDFFRAIVRLVEITGRDVEINTLVLALLGDFITNDIHEEMLEICEVRPMEAILICQNRIASGIEYVLKNTKLNIQLPCHSGNHARTTFKTRNATEAGHSIEYVMYHSLANHFRNEPRVTFLISKNYHSYLDVFGTVIRFHHGHNIRYGGGVGGLYIPVNKAIAQWNKLQWADIDCFGHFHQRIDGGNFMANGCLIGYNAYALAIKAGYEKPSQTFFLIDKKRGKTCTWPILVSD